MNEFPKTSTRVTDPVCGMAVDPGETEFHATHDGVEYHFCSAGCRDRFVADPASFTGHPQPGDHTAHHQHDH
ncbi:YHS domain-containing protein, partial [Nigerium sp.]|uniref:YHS domain-containing protein n=1 Tax=Nigerium sp. TaxID=2042655 RepID=UPI003221E67B